MARERRTPHLPNGGPAHGEPIHRGAFYFYNIRHGVVEIYEGRRDDPDREYVGSVAHACLDDIIAGLKAVRQHIAGK